MKICKSASEGSRIAAGRTTDLGLAAVQEGAQRVLSIGKVIGIALYRCDVVKEGQSTTSDREKGQDGPSRRCSACGSSPQT